MKPNVPIICDAGHTSIGFDTTTSTRTITHDKYISVPAGGSVDVTSWIQKIATITAGVTYSRRAATVSASTVMASLSGTVGVSVAASGTATYQGTETVNYHMGAGRYAVFHGDKKFTGSWSGSRCNSNGTQLSPLSGSAISWAVPGEGAASCRSTYSASSFEYKAKAYAC